MGRLGAMTVVVMVSVGLASCSRSDGTGCDDGGSCTSVTAGPLPSAAESWSKDLAAATEQWAAKRIYSYELSVESYGMEPGFRCTFKVSGGQATLIGRAEMISGSTDSTLPRDVCKSVPNTVEALFEEVRRVLGSNSLDNEAEYDQYGAPKSLHTKDTIIDGGGLRAVVTP